MNDQEIKKLKNVISNQDNQIKKLVRNNIQNVKEIGRLKIDIDNIKIMLNRR